ncbi:putative peptide zinc metalloprotease protein YydH [Rubripirellula obstinata]|uniref:Putative peptide zinc metalloprotease protein YydH n=1 Tax=Rubripirellula obstinata TaxID=406547 RepID=A0A5B1CJZ0_9BACT|nr:HlyD family efflux transporter periplasmic adaptor subunit [Rubripirellula obstinata]KAA1259644.1 putative peptide zinc metalloprotease protein YydH [Rubripirellula obstinata]
MNGVPPASAHRPKLRGDLIHRTIEMGQEPMVVCKDPLSRAYHHFTQSEYELLRLANGHRSVPEISAELKQCYPSSLIESDAVQRFFAQAWQQGLLESENASLPSASRKKWNWLSLLAIRFPGVNPRTFLDAISPLGRLVFAKPVLIASVIAAPLCVIAVLMKFDHFASDFSGITANPFGSLVWIAIAIAVSKVLHELGHALACRHLECECPAIGVMLLFGIPCLYADVSDAWMLKKRSHRMLISAAGMYVECWIAILATLVWMTSNPGPIHDLAVTLMVVCSVSTILINGNPLLRYDGYYLLSDFTGIANLASRSKASLTARFQSMLGKPARTDEPFWMSVFASASYVYRGVVLVSVTTIIFRFLQANDSELIGILFLTTIMAVILLNQAKSFRQTQLTRLVLAGSIFFAALWYPLPRSVVAPMTIVPANAKQIYVTEPGFLQTKPEYGKQLDALDIVSSLSNPVLLRQHAAAVASRDRIETLLQSYQRSRGSQSQSQAMIPSLEKDLEQADVLVDFHNKELQRLNIVPGSAGKLYPPMNSQSQPTVSLVKNAGDNRVSKVGAWINAGTPIGMIGDEHRREAILYLPDREVSRIELGQSVSLMIGDAAKGSVVGTVISIDASPCQHFPESLLVSGLSATSENVYRVRVRLESSGDDLVVHRVGRAKIQASPESITQRLFRLISQTFG